MGHLISTDKNPKIDIECRQVSFVIYDDHSQDSLEIYYDNIDELKKRLGEMEAYLEKKGFDDKYFSKNYTTFK